MTELAGVIKPYRAFAIGDFLKTAQARSCLVALSDDREISEMAERLRYLTGKEILEFPAWDCLPYDRVSPSTDCVDARVDTLTKLAENNGRTVVTSLAALGQRLPPKENFQGKSIALKKGEVYSRQKLIDYLRERNFGKVSAVYEKGEYAVRGDIVDFFAIGEDNPFRVDFFDETVERIRAFDCLSQTTIAELDLAIVGPAREIELNETTVATFKTAYRERFPDSYARDELYRHIGEGRPYMGFERWMPLFFEKTASLVDYLAPETIFIESDAKAIVAENARLTLEYYEARLSPDHGERSYRALPPSASYWGDFEWDLFFGGDVTVLSPFAGEGAALVDVKPLPRFRPSERRLGAFDQIKSLKETHSDKFFVVAALSEGSLRRIERLLADNEIARVASLGRFPDKNDSKEPIYAVTFPLETGFMTKDLLVLSEQDLLGERVARKKIKSGKGENFFKELSELNAGDFVVHVDHGIGRYLELVTVEVEGHRNDCLSIEYADENRLLLPVENLESLSKYGSKDTGVTLDKLGTAHWQSRKARVKKKLASIADYLIELAAKRSLEVGERFDSPKDYDEFRARFPYPETDDQLRAIEEVTDDLASGMPMDRLVCGDVGFGKTEVALRASFLVAAAGKQVAVVVPTTLLCNQHYRSFTERFKGFGVKTARLSRLVKPKEKRAILEEIADGRARVVIATHAIFSEKIKFHDLCLVIVDEEQHFGVKQKEKLKNLKPHVHILTLTATPIPRTLRSALSGIRELSLIGTPPIDRLSVKTFVAPFDGVVVKEALAREYARGGQSFFVVPRVEDLAGMEATLKRLLPNLKIAVAHGRLAPTALEAIITDVSLGKYDILLSTDIVGSGIDMPRVNTIIIHKADRFGLAQLYQLRGRVGRSKIQAYAYLTLPENALIDEPAQKRLQVMRHLDHLGAGFDLAGYDMDIRGAGNPVGEEQSGHVKEVGIELYQTMLREAIARAKAEKANEPVIETYSPQINLGVSLLIPETYVSDLGLRLGLYRRLSGLGSSDEIREFSAEMVDRFGKMPAECENLLKVVELKTLCKAVNVEKIDAGSKGVVIGFYRDTFKNPEALLNFARSEAASKLGSVKIRPDQKIAFSREGLNDRQRIAFCTLVLNALVRL